MTDEVNTSEARGTARRTVLVTAAWAAPIVAGGVAVPALSASEPPVEATSIGATTTSPLVGNVGIIRPFGIDPGGDDGAFPDGQTFTLTSSNLDFSSIVTSITGGTITPTGSGTWLITPNPGVTNVDIRFNSPNTGTYTLTSNGPVDAGQTWGGSVLPQP